LPAVPETGLGDVLNAAVKGFYTFHQSAHSPLFEEPDRMREIMQQDVLRGANRLADEGGNLGP
jgi:hypothetical protein